MHVTALPPKNRRDLASDVNHSVIMLPIRVEIYVFGCFRMMSSSAFFLASLAFSLWAASSSFSF